jgi:hypothetical protein
MEKYILSGVTLTFELNAPTSETGYLKEDFDFLTKWWYATEWIQELLSISNEIALQILLGKVFSYLKTKAKIEKLDYLQKIRVNNIETWLIDDGNTICWMRKEEY